MLPAIIISNRDKIVMKTGTNIIIKIYQ